MSIFAFYTGITVSAIILASCMSGYFAYRELASEKIQNGKIVLYLELERMSGALGEFVTAQSSRLLPTKQAGIFDAAILEDFEKTNVDEHFLTQSSGRIFLLKRNPTNKDIEKVEVNIDEWAKSVGIHKSSRSVFVINKSGEVIFSRNVLENGGISGSKLIKSFIAGGTTSGQIEFTKSTTNKKVIGFYQQVYGTNMLLLAEYPKNSLVHEATKKIDRFAAFLIILVLLVVGSCTWIFRGIRNGFLQLTSNAANISEGKFSVVNVKSRIGEIYKLNHAFTLMAKKLDSREKHISLLAEENKVKVRLENELEIAKSIQSNLLPEIFRGDNNGVEISSIYIPAQEVAGDWFYFHRQESKQFIVIADVSGHGAGSAMFTGVIAGIYESNRKSNDFSAEKFIDDVDKVMHHLGKGNWHASLAVVEIDLAKKLVSVFNAGHPPVFLVDAAADSKSVTRINLPANLVGLGMLEKIAVKTFKLSPGSVFVLYSDCLLEGRNNRGKQFGSAGVKKILEKIDVNSTSEDFVKRIFSGWKGFTHGVPAEDDLCIVVAKVA